MNKIFMLAMANIRKSKGHTVSLGTMIIIAALVLNLGFLMLFGYNSYFDKTAEELNTSDCYITVPLACYDDNVFNFIKNHSNVKKTEKVDFISNRATIKTQDSKEIQQSMLFFNYDRERELTKKKFIGEYLPLDDDSVYVAYYFQIEWGYQLNDTFSLDFGAGEKEYRIKGFVEDVYYNSINMGQLSGYLSDNEYNRLFAISETKGVVFHTNLYEDVAKVEVDLKAYLVNNVNAEIGNSSFVEDSILAIHIPLCKLGRTMMANFIAVMMVALSLIIVIICIIVIRFRIKNSIEEDMIKIGSLKSMGYTSKQIISSITFQFVLIAAIGCVIGISLSYTILNMISDVLAHQSALKWEQGFDVSYALLTLLIILILVALISYTTAGKIKKLNPITVLRGGITTHNFKRNHLPLDKTKGNLSFVLGMKSILQNMRQSIMIFVLTLSVTFAGVFGLIMFYNTVFDTTAMAKMPGTEVANITLDIDPNVTDADKLLAEIKEREGIEYAQCIAEAQGFTIEGLAIFGVIMEDFSQRRTNSVYEGRYPIHDNEMALNGSAAGLMGKKIGDTVIVKNQKIEKEYLITGFQQGVNFGGMNASMTYEGYLRIQPDYMFDMIYIYTEDKVDVPKCLQAILDDYGDVIVASTDLEKEFKEGMSVYTGIISRAGMAMLGISFAIIILVLYFVLNSLVIRQSRILGIQKSIGYTTLQLMNQIAFSVMPSIIMGVVAGGISGALLVNPIMSVAQSGMGVARANYIVVQSWIVLFSIGLIVLSYLASMLITARIRRISAYALVTE